MGLKELRLLGSLISFGAFIALIAFSPTYYLPPTAFLLPFLFFSAGIRLKISPPVVGGFGGVGEQGLFLFTSFLGF
jgi:hypothetical protein